MAKSLLLKVLVDVLGKYVEGLKEENLKLGVWSGKIQFFNLKLKESALDELNLPIRIIRGSLKSLIVKIPWTQLESKPVEIYLEGIYALASPLDLSKFTPEDAKRMGKAAKQEKLRGIDAQVTAAMTKTDNAVQDTAKKASYFQQLATHIVDNLEVNIKNIHIRYEDTISDPKNVFALGVTLDEISLSTTDDNWNIRYIKRNSDSPISGVIHKLGILEHCGIYWNPKSVKTSDKPYDLWEEYMFTTIFKTSVNTMMSDFVYLLDPQNKLTLKLTHSGTATETTPNVDILIESTTIAFNFDRYHFQQIMLVVNSFDELDKRKEWSVHRPLLRPTVDPRAWWYYAYRLIIGKDISFANKMKVMMLCLRNKDKYISLIKQQKIKESKSEKLDSLSETELQTIEDMLPLSALLVFRETAVKEALQDIEASKNQSKFFGSKSSSNNNKIEEKKGSQEESKKSSFFSGWFSSSSSKKPLEPTSPKKVLKEVAVASEEDDTQIMQSVESRFKKFEEESASAVSSSYALRLKLVSSSKLNVAFETAPLAEMSMNLEASVDVKYSNVLIHCDFGNVYLLDQISKNPYNSQVVQMMSLNSKAPVSPSKRIANEQFKPSFVPQCGFDLSIIGNKVGVKVKSLPLVFTWNDDFLRNIVKFFTIEVEENQKKIGKRAVESYKQLDDDKIATTDAGSVVEVDIEVFAPKVVIPENPQFEERCIFVDAGYLSMNGRMTADGMKWKISLSNINIAMPSKKEQILNSGGNIDYLIKPFDVNLQLHNLDKATADICLDGYISPGVVAEFDAEKIIRLVQAILLIIGTFAEEKEKETEKPRAHLTEKPFQAKSTTPNRKRSLLAIPDDAFKSSTEKATKEGKVVKTNPLKISISLSSLECILYIAEGHNAVLNFSQLSFSFLDRPHDSLINFQMNSLDLIDSNRPEDFKSILLAKSSAQNSDNLVEVKYVILKDKRSPLFDGFQSELELRIADVDAFIDSFTTRTYQTLMKDIMHHYKQCFSRGNPSILILESEQAEAESKPSPPANELQGMKFQFLLNKVSVHVLSRLQPTEPALELGFSFHASKLIAEIKQTELVSGKVSLESVCLTDARSRSAGLFYKTLVSNSPSEGTVSISKNNRLVDLQFYQQDTKTMIVEVKVRDLTTTISIDVIMDFVNLLLANIDSFMAVLAQVNLTQETQDEIAKVSKQRKSSMGRNQDEHDSNSVVINLAVENPNLILLEDPSVEHSKAIAATCAITMQYVKETKNAPASESKDVIHLSVQDAEIFVKLDNSENKIAHRIIEPTALEFHMNSVFMSEINVLLDISISAEEIYIRASLNDLVLGAAIIQRFTDRPNTQGFVEMEGAADNYSVQSQNKKENSSIQKDLTMYRFRFNLAKVQVVLINDYNGQNNPLIRIDASQADISFHGASVDLTGEGSITLQGDYYNTELALWEPLMERWQPSLTFQQTTEGKELSVRYDNFVQINVTSILIRCITNAVMLIGRIGEEGTYCSRGNTHPLTIRNQLGIPVDLYEAGSEKPLIALDHDATVKIPHLSEEVRQSRLAREKEFSRSFDLKFSGEYASSFLTFRDLKLDIHKPKIFQLQNTRGSMQRSVSNYAPVVEEIYQYSRFNMLKNSWESPWTNLGDPNEWADAQGKGGRHPSTITLPPGWDWVEPEWKADLNGMVGKEIDKDGWEYALHFNSFGINTKRRMKQAGDCVRRRRWIRTRYMKQEKRATGESFTGRVVWQVISNPDETKQILLRSTKVVLNRFSVGVEIGAESSFANGNCSKVFKVSASGESSFPLLFSEESGIRVRLQGFESGWSEAFPLVLGKNSSQDSQEFKIYQCLCKNNRLISICLMIMEQDGILNLIISPLLEVTNFLPCDIQYKASGMQDDVTILSGGKASAIFFQDNLDVIHFFRLGFYTASIPFKFPKKGYNVEEGLSFFSADKSSALHLKMRLLTTTQGIRHILVYSSLLVVDRSNLGAIFVNSQSRDKNSVDWTRRTLSRQTSRKESNYLVDNESWIMGKNGLALFTPLEKKFHIAFSNGSALINDIESSSLSTSKISLDAVDGSAKKCYHIALKSEPYPVAADLCNVVTLMPAFHVVNHLKKRLYLVQKDVNFDQKAVQEVAPKTTVPFHGSSSRRETEIFFKVEGSDWTLGAIDINEIGTSVLLAVNASDSTSPHVFLNVDVRFSSAEENSYITVVVWESKIWKDPITEKVYREGNVIYSIRNDSHVPITMIQNKISVKERLKSTSRKVTQDNEDSKWAIVVSPGIWQPFAFLDPDAGDEFTFLIGTSLVDTIGTPISLKLSRVGTVAYLGAQEERIQLRLEVKANANGKIITVQSCSDMDLSPYGTSTTSSKRSFDDVQQNDFIVNLNVSCFAISVIADKPSRRELFALALRGIFFELRQIEETKDENAATLIFFKLNDMQIDNFSESAVYPVLLRSARIESGDDTVSKRGSPKNLQFIEYSMVIESPKDQSASLIRYVACRVLEVSVALDSASLLIAASDLLSYVSGSEMSQEKFSLMNAENFNSNMLKQLTYDRLYEVEYQYKASQNQKIFFENLILHPMKFTLDFYPNHFPRKTKEIPPDLRWLTTLESITAVENFQIRIKSFIAENAMESVPSLMERIGNKVLRDIQSDLVQIAGNLVGSLNLIGNPAGLYKNIGSGVQDFFYEPYTGLMSSPGDFLKGIGKGTKGLITGVAGGVVSSAANIVGSATGGVSTVAKGVAAITGDDKYLKKREEKRRELKVTQGGVLEGFKAGGESLVSGFSSGFSGLITKPYEEGQKAGAVGFFKGLGQGLVGVAVKPVIGISEGISSVVQGINQQISDTPGMQHLRPARAFYRRDFQDGSLILVPLDFFAAEAQRFVREKAIKKDYADNFLCAIFLGFNPTAAGDDTSLGFALSEKLLILLSKQIREKWSVPVPSISFVQLVKDENKNYGLKIVLYESNNSGPYRYIPFATRKAAIDGYDTVYRFRYCFGKPTEMPPVEQAIEYAEAKGAGSPRQDDSKQTKVAHYKFGSANRMDMKLDKMENVADSEFNNRYSYMLKQFKIELPIKPEDEYGYHKLLDDILWRIVSNWAKNHDSILNPSRCCACLIINYSSTEVQLLETALPEGANIATYGVGPGYNHNARALEPFGGAAIIFATGRRPTILNLEHVKVVLQTTAFRSMVSTRENRSTCEQLAGFNAVFLEKSRTDWWAKYVISIN